MPNLALVTPYQLLRCPCRQVYLLRASVFERGVMDVVCRFSRARTHVRPSKSDRAREIAYASL